MVGAGSSYLRNGQLSVVVWVTLCHQLMWQGVGYRVPREGVGGVVQGTFHPLSSEIVGHDFALKALEAWVLDFIEPVVVKDWY